MAFWLLSLGIVCSKWRESRPLSLALHPQIFDLYSCHACPGGCNITPPTTIPAVCIQPSLSTNPSLLLGLAIFGAGAAVTAIVLLVMVIVLTCKLRKKSQYHMVASQSQWRGSWLVNCGIDRKQWMTFRANDSVHGCVCLPPPHSLAS